MACSVQPDGPTLSTSCYTTTCSETEVCQSTGSTTTSRTTVACPSVPEYTPWFGGQNPSDLQVMLGDGGFGGQVIETGTWTAPGGSEPPPTTTTFIDCTHRGQQPGQGITQAHCICDGSTFSESLNTITSPAESCAYTAKPSNTISITTVQTVTTDIDNCQVCTLIGNNNGQCTSIDNCTPEPTEPPTPPPEEDPEPEPEPGPPVILGLELCVALSTTPSAGGLAIYNYLAFVPGKSSFPP